MEEPLVSAVMATRNRAQYIGKAVASVFNQTYKNIELIIVDDASVDNTLEVISSLSEKYQRITVLANGINQGYQKSLNRGIEASLGVYIARIDDDDAWREAKKIEKQVAFLENNPEYALTGGGAVWVDKKGNELLRILPPEQDGHIRQKILLKNQFVHSSVVFKKKDWESAGRYDEQFLYCDWTLWMEFGKQGKLYNFPEYFVDYLKWENNITNFNVRKNLKEEIEVRKKYRGDYPNYVKAISFGWALYLSSFLPLRNNMRALYRIIKK